MDDRTRFPAGVVTLAQWTMFGDGSTYQFAWAPEWRVVTNQQSNIPGLRTQDRYHLCAYGRDGQLRVVIPGCQVKGFCTCAVNPQLKGGAQVFSIE